MNSFTLALAIITMASLYLILSFDPTPQVADLVFRDAVCRAGC